MHSSSGAAIVEMICWIEWSLSSGTNSVFKYWWIVPIFVFIFCTSVVVQTCGVVIFCILLKSCCMDLSSWISNCFTGCGAV